MIPSQGAVDRVNRILNQFLTEFMGGGPAVLTTIEHDSEVLAIWEQALRENHFDTVVTWEQGSWGLETRLRAGLFEYEGPMDEPVEKAPCKVTVTYRPGAPPWIPLEGDGDFEAWITDCGDKLATIALIRNMRDVSLKGAAEIVEGKYPVFAGVSADVFVRAASYLKMSGAKVSRIDPWLTAPLTDEERAAVESVTVDSPSKVEWK